MHFVMFTQQNHLRTHFSEHVPVIKWSMAVLFSVLLCPAQTLCRAQCATGSRKASHFQVDYVVDAQLSPQPSSDATSPSTGNKVFCQPEGSWHCLWMLICFWTHTHSHTHGPISYCCCIGFQVLLVALHGELELLIKEFCTVMTRIDFQFPAE